MDYSTRQAINEYLRLAFKNWVSLISVCLVVLGVVREVSGWLVISSWVWFMIAILGLFIAQFRAFNKVRLGREELTTSRITKDTLGEFMSEGDTLALRCANEKEPPPLEEILEWIAKVEQYLGKHFGSSYISRFRSSAGLPTGFTTIESVPHRNLHSWVRVRVARLNEFISEMG